MTKIAFTGDVAFTKHFSGTFADENLLDREIVDFLSSSDYTVVNMEGAVNNGPIQADKPLTHANPVECVDWMKKINGTIWNLANNHAMDCGEEGMKSTLEVAESNKFLTLGAGMDINAAKAPVIIDRDGGIGIVSVTYDERDKAGAETPGCFWAEDEEEVKRQIQEIKQKNKWCIVVSHVGHEFSQMPLPYLRNRYKRYLSYGADVIVGHHPHVVQNYEKFGDKIVFYSLGNFIFDTNYQRAQSYTDCGILLKLQFNEDEFNWDFIPTKIDRKSQRIFKGETPAIFRNISGFEHGLLWPLMARHLSKNEHKKNAFTHPEWSDRTWLQWFLKSDIKKCEKPYGKDLMLGRFLSLFGLWNFADRNIVRYIQEK